MSLLAPLYFLGLAAVSLPILLHLIRRTPRGRRQFSSLMFLTPSPPRLTRRSRIENWLLLLLRAAALILLALAFARPFLRQVANLSLDGVRGRRVAVLLDTSASMRRDGVWSQAISKLNELLDRLDPADEVALFTFDSGCDAVVPFAKHSPVRRESTRGLVRQRAQQLEPSWRHSDLGAALVTLAEELTLAVEDTDNLAVPQIIVISDLQQGADLKALQEYEWPEDVLLAVEAIEPKDPSNGTLSVLRAEDEPESVGRIRVRVANSAESTVDQFYVAWKTSASQADRQRPPDPPAPRASAQTPRERAVSNDAVPVPNAALPVYVPAGQSRVVQLPLPDADSASDQLVLTGDAAPFDNTFYVVPQIQDEVQLIYIGNDRPDDPAGLQYYLRLALSETPQRKVNVTTHRADQPLVPPAPDTRLVVVTTALSQADFQQLGAYVESGGSALFVPSTSAAATALAEHFDQVSHLPSETAVRSGDYRLLVDIDFTHPLFKPFATPRYSDFTKIHFWKHQRFEFISEHTARVLANFDNGDPALWEQSVGAGRFYVLASGWHPDDSQLALSTKFVPLLNTMLDQAAGGAVVMPSLVVGEAVAMPDGANTFSVTKPDGTTHALGTAGWFRDTDQPGIYVIEGGASPTRFAVNLAARETDTARMDVEQLSELGLPLGEHRTREEESQRQRQLRDIELESQQQLWRWLIVGVLGVLGIETWLAGRGSRTRTRSEGDVE